MKTKEEIADHSIEVIYMDEPYIQTQRSCFYGAMYQYAVQMLQWIEDNDIKNLTPEQTAKFYYEECATSSNQ